MSKKEIRYIPTELRAIGDGNTVCGHAAVFNQASNANGMCPFTEVLAPGCFDRCLSGNPDIVCLTEHSTENLLGRTKSGTLRVKTDNVGLYFECDLPDTNLGRDTKTLLLRGDLNQMSFGFIVSDGGQTWSKLPDGSDLRTLTDIECFDVSIVAFPFYANTDASLRSKMFPEGEVVPPAPVVETPAETPTVAETRENDNGCECECPQCEADMCDQCSDGDCDDPNCRCSTRHVNLLMASICAALARD